MVLLFQVDAKRFLKLLVSIMEPGTDSPLRTPHDLGDLGMRKSLNIK